MSSRVILLACLAAGLLGASGQPTHPPTAIVVMRGPSLLTARAAHTLTTLPDGRLLVCGGFTDTNQIPVAEAEVFDPVRRSFRRAGRLTVARYGHTASVLPDGSVLLVGGWNASGRAVASAEIFDPARNTFRPAASLRGPRAGHLATPLRDGRFLVTGGVDDRGQALASAEIYDPATRHFHATGSMQIGREGHVAVLLSDGRVLVCGGHAGRGAALRIHAEAEIFDPDRGQFHPTGNLSVPRHKHDAVLLPDGRVLVTGGASRGDESIFSTELFQPAPRSFKPGSAMHHRRFKHFRTSVLLIDGTVPVLGGAAVAERYLPSEDRFERIAAPELWRSPSFSTAAPSADGSILLAGGYDDAIRATAATWLIRALSTPDQP